MKRVALVAALVAAIPAVARAQPAKDPTDQARELFAQGKRYYDLLDYAHAIGAWKQAYVLASSPTLLFNIGQAYRLSGDCASAVKFYASYEREMPSPPNKDELAQAKALCAAAPVKPDKPAPVRVPTPVPDKPPPSTTAALGQTDLDGGSAAAKPVAARPPAQPDPDAGHGAKLAGIATAGAGLALVVTGIVFASKASSAANTIEDFKGPWDDAHANLQSSGKTDATIGLVTTTVGIAALIGGGALYYLGMHREHEPHVGVAIAPGHTELTWSAHF